jgi:hypothetical protein
MKTWLKSALAVTATCLVLGFSSNAFAWLQVCNSTSKTVVMNFLFHDSYCANEGRYGGEGWFYFSPNTCGYVNGFSQNGYYVYYHAASTDNTEVWTSGSYQFWMPYAAHSDYCIDYGDNGSGGVWLNHRELHITSDNYTIDLIDSGGCGSGCSLNGDICSCPQ